MSYSLVMEALDYKDTGKETLDFLNESGIKSNFQKPGYETLQKNYY